MKSALKTLTIFFIKAAMFCFLFSTISIWALDVIGAKPFSIHDVVSMSVFLFLMPIAASAIYTAVMLTVYVVIRLVRKEKNR